ncbi:hypothetical protein SAMN05660831_01706 [Thiohalospira halophila DSM 15071]|uniref:Uncharacterized protein n=1 Tax=Thiohalospira halophila DSM 15071 TaxID=1123397 RepID=A0A1I1SIQ7_9GAMM|nr:hypothetical protein [Thiohalospira halophila]SFD46326.1 hypothetical protein SAMN05660831_01706 [Thiohalospira halophila DSM 15071]
MHAATEAGRTDHPGGFTEIRLTTEAAPRPGQYLTTEDGTGLPVMAAGNGEVRVLVPGPVPSAITAVAVAGEALAPEPSWLAVADAAGLAPLLFAASGEVPPGLALLGLDEAPFTPRPSRFLTPELPAHLIAAAPLLEDRGIASRLALPDHPAAWEGTLAELVATAVAGRPRPVVVLGRPATIAAVEAVVEGPITGVPQPG